MHALYNRDMFFPYQYYIFYLISYILRLSQKSKIAGILSEIAFLKVQETKALNCALEGAELLRHRLANEADKNFKDGKALVDRATGTAQTKLF